MIEFIECQKTGYKARTEENVINSDVTIAFARDFSTYGEIATKNLCRRHNKIYVPFNLNELEVSFRRMMSIVGFIDKKVFDRGTDRNNICLNIAGNGIYNLVGGQALYDEWMEGFLTEFTGRANSLYLITSSCSGGQTGIDEAGSKATNALDIPTIIRAPKRWLFRGEDGKDIASESLFKQRFL